MKGFRIFTYILSAFVLTFGIVTWFIPSLWTDDIMKTWMSVMLILLASYMLDSVEIKRMKNKENEEVDKK